MHYSFTPKSSKWFLIYLIFSHCFAVFCIALIVPISLILMTACLVVISFYYHLFHYKKITQLRCHEKIWEMEWCDGKIYHAQLQSSSVMLRYWLILHFETMTHQKKTVMLCFDMFSVADYKALRRCVKASV